MQHQIIANRANINLPKKFDTLTFSKNMIKVGMDKKISDELALNINGLETINSENIKFCYQATENDFNFFKIEFKKDIDDLKLEIVEIKKEIKDLKNEIKDLRNEFNNLNKDFLIMRNEMTLFKIEIRQEMQDFKDEIRKEMQNFKDEIRKEMLDFKNEIRKEIQDFKSEINLTLKTFKDEFDLKISKMATKEELHNELQKLSMSMTIRMGIIMSAGIGIIGYLIKF